MILKRIKITINNLNFSIKTTWKMSKFYVILTIFSAILTSSYRIFMTLMVSVIINKIQLEDINTFISMILIFAVVSLALNIINAVTSNYFIPILDNRISNIFQSEIYDKYLESSLEELLNKEYYDLYYFVLNKGKPSIIGLVSTMGKLLSNIISIIGISALFLQYDYFVIIIIIIGVFISFISSTIKEKRKYDLLLETIPDNRKIDYVNRLFYLPDYSKEVHAGDMSIFFDFYRKAYRNIKNIIKNRSKKLILLDLITSSSTSFSTIIALSLLGIKTIKGDFLLGTFAMLYTGIQQITGELSSLFLSFPSMYSLSLNVQKYHDFMSNNKFNENKKIIEHINTIQLNNVSFSYNDENINTINKINLTINYKKRKIAIVGENGSGKSTLINLILGLYKPQSGKILINDIDINELDKRIFRKRISPVFQDFKTYSLSIAQNILMKSSYESYEKDMIIDSLKKVGLYEKVSNLQHGIDSIISNEFEAGGVGFSTGELQKIVLARSYISNSDILILDEPYSFSDVYSKAEMNGILDNISKNKIVLMITHDIYNLENMDVIYVVEKGKIVEQGKQDNLLELKGKFFSMYNAKNNR